VTLPRLLRTSSFRLTLLYVGVFSLSVLLLFGIVMWSAAKFMDRQIDMTVAAEMAEVKADAADATLPAVIAQLANRSPGFFYLLQDHNGTVIAGNMDPIRPQPGARVLRRPQGHGGRIAGRLRGAGEVLADGSYLFIGQSDIEVGEMQEVIARAFLVGLAATVILGVAGGIATSLGLLARIETISRTSREIMAGDLGRRIALRGSDDEFDHLASSLNAMLNRIQELMRGVEQVSNDIAHDLRTPLTRLRQRLELAYRRETTVDQLRAALEASIHDSEAILETFSALLRIAQIESGARRAGFASVDLGLLLEELAEAYQPVVEEAGQKLAHSVDFGVTVLGDRELLTQLFVNLIENAIRHAGPGASITMGVGSGRGGWVDAVVADDGPGVPIALRTKVLERFTRLDTSRNTPGNGLGLSLVAAIAQLHLATIALEDNAPGLRCIVRFACLK
jgi:signal transduction histidine kinase